METAKFPAATSFPNPSTREAASSLHFVAAFRRAGAGLARAAALAAALAAAPAPAGAREPLRPSLPAAEPVRKTAIFVNPGKRGEVFWELVAKSMAGAARRMNIALEIVWSERNKVRLRELGVEAAGRRPDYLILVNEENAAEPALEAATAAGVSTLFLLNPLNAGQLARRREEGRRPNLVVGVLTPDMIAAGRRMGERLVAAARDLKLQARDGKLHFLALAGDEITQTSIDRTKGFADYAATQSDVVVDRLLVANWNRDEAHTLSRRYLALMRNAGLRPAGVWAANDPIAQGAIEAFEAEGKKMGADAVAVGLNWSPQALDDIAAGRLLLTEGGHFLGGAAIIAMARQHADGCRRAADGAAAGEELRATLTTSALDRTSDAALLDLIRSGDFDRIDFADLATVDGFCQTRFDAARMARASTAPRGGDSVR